MSDTTQINADIEEASLIWDEYKYRHDLIWRHLIRSTVAVIALISVSYSTAFINNKLLYIIAALLAVFYTVFSFIVLQSELKIFEQIKILHRSRQRILYNLHTGDEPSKTEKALAGRFSMKARFYLLGLFVLTLAATIVLIESIF